MPLHEEPLSFQANDRRVSAVLALPDTPTDRAVLLCHGFLSNKNSTTNKTLTRALTERGLATFRFDFFGQGDSEGPFEAITVTAAVHQAVAALDLLKSRGFRRIGLVGSSFGGLVALFTAAQRSDLACVGLKCPVADFPEVLRLEFGEAGMVRWKSGHEIPDVTGGTTPVRLRYAFYENCLQYDGYKAAEKIAVPSLIVQGDKDALVPLHQSRRLFDAFRGEKRLEILPGADHGFSKGDDFKTMASLLVDWTTSHLA